MARPKRTSPLLQEEWDNLTTKQRYYIKTNRPELVEDIDTEKKINNRIKLSINDLFIGKINNLENKINTCKFRLLLDELLIFILSIST